MTWVKNNHVRIFGLTSLVLAAFVFFGQQNIARAANTTTFILDTASGVTCNPNYTLGNDYTDKSTITFSNGHTVITNKLGPSSPLDLVAKDPAYTALVASIKKNEQRPYIYFTPSSTSATLQSSCNRKYGVFISDPSDPTSFKGINANAIITGIAAADGTNSTFSIRSTATADGTIGSIIDTVVYPTANISGLSDALTKPPFKAAGNTSTTSACDRENSGGCVPTFTDFNTITYSGDTYKLTSWSSEMKYQKVGAAGGAEQCVFFQLDTDTGGGNGGYDLNVDDANKKNVEEVFETLRGIGDTSQKPNRMIIKYNDGTAGCSGKTSSTFVFDRQNFLKIFRYDNATKSLKPVINSFGSNEGRYFNGEYKQKADKPTVFEKAGDASCAGNPSYIELGSIPKGSETVTATWNLVIDTVCTKVTAPLTISVITAAEKVAADAAIAEATKEAKPPITCTGTWRHAVSWIACGVISIAEDMINKIDEMLQKFLFVNVDKFDNAGALHRSWSNIRQFSTIILVIMALVMIFTEAMGSGILDNYSVKKILPRIVIAGIGIQLSWEISKFLINVGNIFGNGIQGILLSPFGGRDGTSPLSLLLPSAISGEAKTFGFALAIGGAVAMGPVLGAAIGIIIALIVAFVTLILRYMVIIMCMLFAPVFIALSVLPGTNKLTKFWWESFEKAIIMYPLIMVILAAGKIVAFGLITAGTTKDASGKIVSQDGWFVLAALVAAIAPYAAFPQLVQAAGGALKKVTGVVNDRSKGMFDGAKKWGDNRGKMKQARGQRNAFDPNHQSWYGKGSKNPLKFVDKSLKAKTRGGAYLSAGAIGPGTSFERDSMYVKNAQEASNRKMYNKEQALLDVQSQEKKTAVNRALLGLQNQSGKGTSVKLPDGTNIDFGETFDYNKADHIAKIASESKDKILVAAAVDQIVKTGSGKQFRNLTNTGIASGNTILNEAISNAKLDSGFYGVFKDTHADLAKGGVGAAFGDGFDTNMIMGSKGDTIATVKDSYKAALNGFNNLSTGASINDTQMAAMKQFGYDGTAATVTGATDKLKRSIKITTESIKIASSDPNMRGSFKQAQATEAYSMMKDLNILGEVSTSDIASIRAEIDQVKGVIAK
jgi:hypothetical protein